MRNRLGRPRWFFVVIMFLFLFFQQWMGFLIEPITIQFSQSSSIIDRWMDTILPVDVIFMIFFFLVWGILFDRHSRKRLLSLAGFLWGVSAWLMGIAPSFTTFNISRGISGIAQASHSGVFAMVGDLFKPTNRGKVLAILLLAQPLAIVFGTLVPNIDAAFGWRPVLVFFGAIGFLVTISIQLSISEPKRGAKEPALAGIRMTGTYLLDWEIAPTVLLKPSLILTYAFIFFGTIPVIVLLEGLIVYFRDGFGLSTQAVYSFMSPAMVGVLLGYPVGGFLGDFLFRFRKNGRLFSSLFGLVFPPVFLYLALQSQDILGLVFLVYMLLVSFFMAFALPNLFASIMDVALPEVRASACALGLLFQAISFLVTPWIFSMVQGFLNVGDAILWICVSAWMICLMILSGLFIFIPKDIERLRRHMAYRSQLEVRLEQAESR